MAGKIFISCGQANQDEIKVAEDISNWLTSEGFQPYVAIMTQSILDINSGIISELKSSDYYLFINFKRDEIVYKGQNFYRGSVFTNQELAIAYAMRFDKMLFVNQKEVRREGIFGYMGSNTPEFEKLDEVLPIVKKAISDAKWEKNYSRNLIVNEPWWSDFFYNDHASVSKRHVRGLHINVLNNRSELGSSFTVCRLNSITQNGIRSESPDRSHLKCCGQMGYNTALFPRSHASFDLLSIDLNSPTDIYLHSALDYKPRGPIITQFGKYIFEYEIMAQGFQLISFNIDLDFKYDPIRSTAKLII